MNNLNEALKKSCVELTLQEHGSIAEAMLAYPGAGHNLNSIREVGICPFMKLCKVQLLKGSAKAVTCLKTVPQKILRDTGVIPDDSLESDALSVKII